ncbi:MAG: hypothetical protein JNN13_04990 [Planctomycetes bacterium]|nr:hypothetical protein [Planctomycetota bacterium]MBZ0153891.1 hypothetical protein [Planctomycetota bacterium]MCC7064043.1 hypothetical protein [Planctomycetota bacterium]
MPALLTEGAALRFLPMLAMGIFAAIFLTVLLRVLQRARKPEYDHMASLPLEHDSQSE